MGARASPIGLVVAVLLLKRLPVVLATRGLLGNIGGGEGAFFLVWFGPIGLTATPLTRLYGRRNGDGGGRRAGAFVATGANSRGRRRNGMNGDANEVVETPRAVDGPQPAKGENVSRDVA